MSIKHINWNGRKVSNAESSCNIMKDLFDKYYGETVEKDNTYVIWSRISHFQFTILGKARNITCFASSALLYENAIKGKDDSKREDSLRKYIELLSSGGNDFPMNQLEKAGWFEIKRNNKSSIITTE